MRNLLRKIASWLGRRAQPAPLDANHPSFRTRNSRPCSPRLFEAAFADGRAAERKRVAEILHAPGAREFPQLAIDLALGDATAAQAAAIFAREQKTTRLSEPPLKRVAADRTRASHIPLRESHAITAHHPAPQQPPIPWPCHQLVAPARRSLASERGRADERIRRRRPRAGSTKAVAPRTTSNTGAADAMWGGIVERLNKAAPASRTPIGRDGLRRRRPALSRPSARSIGARSHPSSTEKPGYVGPPCSLILTWAAAKASIHAAVDRRRGPWIAPLAPAAGVGFVPFTMPAATFFQTEGSDMRSIRFDLGPDPIDAPSAIDNVRFAVALLMGASTSAEAHIARTTGPTPDVLAAAGPLGRIIKACNQLEAAVTAPAHMPSATTRASIAAVNTAHMPSPATLKTIAAVEAVRASMPSAATRATIAPVEAAQHAVSRTKG